MTIRTDDMLAIGQTLARYCRGIDRLDADLIASAYWPGAYDDHGPFKGTVEAFIAWIVPLMCDAHAVHNHALNQSYYEFRGDRAAVETNFVVRSVGKGDQAGIFRILSGRYLDLLEKRGDAWRILNRTTMYDSAATAPELPQNFERIVGSRSRDDLSYHIFDAIRGEIPEPQA